jgi:hypothetical protein
MAERPEHALVVDFTNVLRAFTDRQLELLTVVRELRLDLGAPSGAPVHASAVATAPSPILTLAPPLREAPPAPVVLAPPIPIVAAPPTVVEPPPTPVVEALTVVETAPVVAREPFMGASPEAPASPEVEEVPEIPTILTLRTKRDYNYFDALDLRLAQLRKEGDPSAS